MILTDNAASRAVLEKCGFGEGGRFEAGFGRHADSPVVRMTLRRDEWRASPGADLRPALPFDRAIA